MTITVAASPIALQLATFGPFVEGSGPSGLLATFKDLADSNTDPSQYAASIAWGDGTTSAGRVIADPSGGFDVVGSHTYLEELTFGLLIVSVTDTDGASGSLTYAVGVQDAPLANVPVAVRANPGQPFSGPVAAFTDTDPNGTLTDYTATITWGDGSPNSAGQVVVNPNGGFQVLGSHTFTQPGPFPNFQVRIDDNPAYLIVGQGMLTVTSDYPLSSLDTLAALGQPVYATKGEQFRNVPVAEVFDANPNPGPLKATIDWADGSTAQGTVTPAGPHSWQVLGTHTYTTTGPLAFHVYVYDNANNLLVWTSATAIIDDPAAPPNTDPIFSGASYPAQTGQPLQNVLLATYQGSLPADPTTVTATVDWGDNYFGADTSTQIIDAGDYFEVVGSHSGKGERKRGQVRLFGLSRC